MTPAQQRYRERQLRNSLMTNWKRAVELQDRNPEYRKVVEFVEQAHGEISRIMRDQG